MSDQVKIGIVAFGFGEPSNTCANASISESVRTLLDKSDILFTDRDIAPHFKNTELEVIVIDPSRKPTTYRLARMATEEAESHGLNTLYVVAAPCHTWRCLRDLRWVADDLEVLVKFVSVDVSNFQFDSTSTTRHTKAAWMWWSLEIPYRFLSSLFPAIYKRLRS